MAGSIDDIDMMSFPKTGCRGRRDGDTALALLLHPVHGRRSLMHFTDLMGDTGIEKHALGRRGLPGVDMRDDADIAILIDRSRTGHKNTRFKILDY